MPFDLRTILAPQNLLGLVQSIKGGVPELLPPGLFSKVRPTVGNTGSYRRVMATRQLAPVVQYGAPPVPVNGQDVIEVSEKLVHTIVSKPFDASFYNNLQGLSDITAQRYAEDVVSYETAELKRRVTNLMAACKYSVLSQGVIYVDHTQQFAFGSSSSQYTINFGVPASNQTDIATFTGVTGLWSNSDTDIPLQLRALKQLAVQATGYPITHCLYGKSIPDFIQNNTAVADLVRGNYVLATEQYRTTEIPPMLGDINWLPMYSAFAEDSSGTQHSLWPDNLAVFIPDPGDDWQEMLEGTRRIPTTFGAVGGDALSVLQTGVDAQGLFSYASVDRHLIVEQTVGNTFLPVLKVPAAIYQLTVAQAAMDPDPFTQVAQAIVAALAGHAGFSALVQPGNLIDPTSSTFEDYKADVSPGDLPEALLRPREFELAAFGPSSRTAGIRQKFDLVITTDALRTTSLHAVKYQALRALATAGDTLGLEFVRTWSIHSGEEHDSPKLRAERLTGSAAAAMRGTRRWVAALCIDVQIVLSRDDLLN